MNFQKDQYAMCREVKQQTVNTIVWCFYLCKEKKKSQMMAACYVFSSIITLTLDHF